MALDSSDKVIDIDINEEMKKSYINYSMSVIVDRALPDVRDGMKPVHRRILYTMHQLGLGPKSQFKKSARIVGDTMGKYHPHGDTAIYDAMVRLAQDFSTRYPLVDGHGNFGSLDGDPPAAMRYTEARLSALALEMIRDIDKDTVDFVPNFDGEEMQPVVLPSRIPNLLINGASGIAVGMATNIPPHNLGEVIDGLVAIIDDPDVDIHELLDIVKGPDFPTGGIILGRQGIKKAYLEGRGRIRVRARAEIEEMRGGKYRIVISEIPYMVNKSTLVEKIATLVRTKKIDGITDLRDESDREIRVIIEVRKDVNPQILLNQLYKHTQMQETFGAIMLALVDGQPKVLNLKEMMVEYLKHQEVVNTRRYQYELGKAEHQAHIREGLLVALDNIDEVIRIIRESPSDKEALDILMTTFGLTEVQGNAILDMRLRRLTSLESEKVLQEYKDLQATIAEYRNILGDRTKLMGIVREDLLSIKDKYADKRRTTIAPHSGSFDIEDLIADEDVVVMITKQGYIKRLAQDTYKSQNRGGRGVIGMETKEEDYVEHIFVANTLDTMLFFTTKGLVHQLKTYQIPDASRQSRGTSIVNLLQIDREEVITAVISIKDFEEEAALMMMTKLGKVKRTNLEEYDTRLKRGLIAMRLGEDDELISVVKVKNDDQVFIATSKGKAIRIRVNDVRCMGRATTGVRGIDLSPGDFVVAMDIVKNGRTFILTVTENGYGKRTRIGEYRIQGRGGKGLINMKVNKKTGNVINARTVYGNEEEQVIIATKEAIVLKTSVDTISIQGRSTQGVLVMRPEPGDKVVALALGEE
ncbi:MAG: DNA gyrase subunit A [Firmicutes bacterium]|nr:DNA gyrase subunit A [Bacillota bacterium]